MAPSLIRDVLEATAKSYAFVVLLAVLVAVLLAPVAGSLLAPAPTGSDGAVAIVPIDGTITTSRADTIAWDLREARERDDVKAVVLQVDSPGGSAAASEHLYIAVRRTAAEMPVVVAVEAAAASGAYYASVPADTIYVTPASIVGSVGVRASYPSGGFGDEIVTGPDKNTGGTTAEARARVETIQNAFVGAVVHHRGDRLQIDRQTVANAKIYAGARAVEVGMADRIGVLDDAVDHAADLAGLESSDVLHTSLGSGRRLSQVADGGGPGRPTTDREPFGYGGVDTTTYLMLWGQVDRSSGPGPGATTDSASATEQNDPQPSENASAMEGGQ